MGFSAVINGTEREVADVVRLSPASAVAAASMAEKEGLTVAQFIGNLILDYEIGLAFVRTGVPVAQGPEGAGYELPTCRACGFPGFDDHESCSNCETS